MDFARSAEGHGYDALWTQETAGRDPFTLLGHLAAHTSRLRLGVGIAVIYGRDATAMHAGAATVHELSGGRMVLGLGASHRDTVSEVRGHEYRGPLTAMRKRLVRGVALKSEQMQLPEWIDALGAAIEERATTSQRARDALSKLTGGG